MTPKTKQIVKLIELAIEKDTSFVKGCNESDQRQNPQVVEMRLKAEGRIDGLDCVLRAIKGDNCLLRIIAGQ